MKKVITIPSTDNQNILHVVIWEPETDVRGIVQISHGMIEYVERFDNLAKSLNDKGYLCIGNDHLGHGQTAATKDDLGYFGEGLSKTVVDDLHKITQYAKSEYGRDLPYFLFGHSMGSFMARRYISTYGSEIDGVILSGTGFTPGLILSFGKLAANVVKLFKGDRYRSSLLTNLAFGSYNKKIENAKTTHDWLTKDEAVVNRYLNDEYCTFMFTVNGYRTLFDVLSFIQKKESVNKIPKDLPVLMISGDADPVGDYGKGVKKVYEQYVKSKITDVTIELYKDDRHELTNECDKELVYNDIIRWVDDRLE